MTALTMILFQHLVLVWNSGWRMLQTSQKYTFLQPQRPMNRFSRVKQMSTLFVNYFEYPLKSCQGNTSLLYFSLELIRQRECVQRRIKCLLPVSQTDQGQIPEENHSPVSDEVFNRTVLCWYLPVLCSWRAYGKAPLLSLRYIPQISTVCKCAYS